MWRILRKFRRYGSLHYPYFWDICWIMLDLTQVHIFFMNRLFVGSICFRPALVGWFLCLAWKLFLDLWNRIWLRNLHRTCGSQSFLRDWKTRYWTWGLVEEVLHAKFLTNTLTVSTLRLKAKGEQLALRFEYRRHCSRSPKFTHHWLYRLRRIRTKLLNVF